MEISYLPFFILFLGELIRCYNCPVGSYCPVASCSSSLQCTVCEPGSFCPGGGKVDCPEGYYCPGGEDSPNDCPVGHSCPERSAYPGECYMPGEYQPQERQSSCIKCPAGKYCAGTVETDFSGQSVVTGDCTAGFFCPEGSYSEDGKHDYYPNGMNNPCSAGFYCPSGTSTELNCGAGYYCPSGSSNRKICTAGKYCSGNNLVNPSGDCSAGYYCPSGSTSSTQNTCQEGDYCPIGSPSRSDCGASFYCSIDAKIRNDCQIGYYCPGNRMTSQTICPSGKYCDQTRMTNYKDCSLGSYCPEGSFEENSCKGGYYCANPSTRVQCSKGAFCPSGSTKETKCPAGKYCQTNGLSSPTGNCQEGFYCPEGSISPTENLCPKGNMCPTGSGEAIPCTNGKYQNEKGESDCLNCPIGSFCKNPSQDPITCPGGQYCDAINLEEPTGNCSIGYFCPDGSTSSTEFKCEIGYYCPEGSFEQVLCCNGHGNCTNIDQTDCSCIMGYYGDQCESYECFGFQRNDPNVCNSNGFCDSINECKCFENYQGEQCEDFSCFNISKSDPNVCNGNGECVNFDTCECVDLWLGNNCESSLLVSVILPIASGVAGVVIITLIIIIIVTMIICFCFCAQKKKIDEFNKYEDEINLLKLDEKERDNNLSAKFSISKEFFTISNEDIKLIRSLGQGGFGEVFYCEWEGSPAAIKLCTTISIGTEKNDFEMFEKELSLMSSISHPNIVQFHGCCLRTPRIGLIMEYCESGTLSNKLHYSKNIPFIQKLDWLIQISSAIAYLHKRGVMHRDLKPDNILLTNKNGSNVAKLCDFGISRSKSRKNSEEMTKQVGTSSYMAPEVAMGKNYSYSCDVYSFAIIMYVVLTQNIHPYSFFRKEKTGIEILIATKKIRPKTDGIEKKYQWFVDLMIKCWDDNPEERDNIQEINDILKKKRETLKLQKKPSIPKKRNRMRQKKN